QEVERRPVGEVRHIDPALPQDAGDLVGVGGRGEMGGHAGAAEDVGDDHVRRVGRGRLHPGAGVRGVQGDVAVGGQRQVCGDEVQQGAVGLDHLLPGAGPGDGQVAGQGEGAAAQVHRVQWASGPVEGVQDVAEPPGVLELQVAGVVEVDVGLRGPVD